MPPTTALASAVTLAELFAQKADVHQTDHRQKADAGQQVCQNMPFISPAHKLKKTAYASLAEIVFFPRHTGFEVICGRK